MPVNLYKCEKCGEIFVEEAKCLACERSHSEFEQSLKTEYAYAKGKELPTHIRVLSPSANNKPFGRSAEYVLSGRGTSKTPTTTFPPPKRLNPVMDIVCGRLPKLVKKRFVTMISHSEYIKKYGRPNNWPWWVCYRIEGIGYVDVGTLEIIKSMERDIIEAFGVFPKIAEGKRD